MNPIQPTGGNFGQDGDGRRWVKIDDKPSREVQELNLLLHAPDIVFPEAPVNQAQREATETMLEALGITLVSNIKTVIDSAKKAGEDPTIFFRKYFEVEVGNPETGDPLFKMTFQPYETNKFLVTKYSDNQEFGLQAELELFPEQQAALIRKFHVTVNKKRQATIRLEHERELEKAQEKKSMFVLDLSI